MKNKVIAVVVIILIAAGGVYFLKNRRKILPQPVPDTSYTPTVPDVVKADSVLLNVPFTSQAPLGNWSDPRQEEGCEEASLLMAWSWLNNKAIVPADAEKTIDDMSDFETAHYGNYNDLDATDTAKLMADYYHYTKAVVKTNITMEDIKKELSAGHLVLVPANGQKLGNPHYKAPGPLTHFLVVIGFNDATGRVTTNDSGTQFGKGYQYSYNTFYNALVDYPSGKNESQAGRPKSMIVITK